MISVVMPAYNSEAFIGQAIESILKQTFTDFEFIIVDDGSTDRTLDIIRSYAAGDDRIRLIQASHGGVSRAMNTGIQNATREWVAVMHSDDVALPQRLERQIEAAQVNPEVVIWGTNGYHINAAGKRLSAFFVGPKTSEEYHERRNRGEIVQVIHPTAMLRREIVLAVGGYNSRMDVCEDIDLFDRMMIHGELRTIDEPLMEYRIHNASLSMKYFMRQHILAAYVSQRQISRLNNQPEPDLDEFLTAYQNQPWRVRFRLTMTELSRLHYRSVGLALGEKHALRALYHASIAILLNPAYAIGRAWTQVFSKEARQRLR